MEKLEKLKQQIKEKISTLNKKIKMLKKIRKKEKEWIVQANITGLINIYIIRIGELKNEMASYDKIKENE